MPSEITVQLEQIGPATSEVTIRGHKVLVDRPETKGGTDRGPMGGELFLAAIGGCFMSTLLAAIRARSLPITDVRVRVVGTLLEAPTRYESIALEVAGASEDRRLLAQLVEVSDRGCIMTNTLRNRLDVRVRLSDDLAVID
jgi:putative redox protein